MKRIDFDDLPDEDATTKLARGRLIDFVCRMKSPECLSRMHSKLRSHIDNSDLMPVDSQSSVFCSGLMASAALGEGSALIEPLWKEMQASDNTEYRLRIIDSLGCYGDVKVLYDLLETTLATTNEVRYLTGESFEVVQSVYSKSVEGVEATMDFMIEFPTDAVRRLQTPNLIGILVENLSKRIFSERLLVKVNKPGRFDVIAQYLLIPFEVQDDAECARRADGRVISGN